MTTPETKKKISLVLTTSQAATLETLAARNAVPFRQYLRDLIGREATAAGLPWSTGAFRRRSPNGINQRKLSYPKKINLTP